MLSLTHQALDKFDNTHDFERMCADILNGLGYREVIPVAPAGGGDGGKDITYKTSNGQSGLACVTLRKDIDKKFKEDFHRRQKGDYQEYILFTTRSLSAGQKLAYTKYCANELEASFLPQDIESIRSLLDSALKSTRKQYLHIEDDDDPKYTIELTDVRRYSAAKLVEAAAKAYDEKKREFMRRSSVFGVMPTALPALGVSSTEDVIKSLSAHCDDLEQFNERVKSIVSFNVLITSDKPDKNIEVKIYPPAGCKLSLDQGLIEIPDNIHGPSPLFLRGTTAFIARHMSVQPRWDENEFYASYSRSGSFIKSNLASLNAAHQKYALNEDGYVVGIKNSEPFTLTITIHSNSLTTPIEQVITVDTANNELIELEEDDSSED
jgi:hypothetical protein